MDTAISNLAKRNAAESAVSLVESGLAIGLGSRSTAEIVIRMLAEKVKRGLRMRRCLQMSFVSRSVLT